MKVYRPGRHWGVTVVEETEGNPDGGRLICMATSMADAQNICEAMTFVHRLAVAQGREIVDLVDEIRNQGRTREVGP